MSKESENLPSNNEAHTTVFSSVRFDHLLCSLGILSGNIRSETLDRIIRTGICVNHEGSQNSSTNICSLHLC